MGELKILHSLGGLAHQYKYCTLSSGSDDSMRCSHGVAVQISLILLSDAARCRRSVKGR